MADQTRPFEPKVPPHSRPPRGDPAPLVTGAKENAELTYGNPIRGGAGAIPAIWEE